MKNKVLTVIYYSLYIISVFWIPGYELAIEHSSPACFNILSVLIRINLMVLITLNLLDLMKFIEIKFIDYRVVISKSRKIKIYNLTRLFILIFIPSSKNWQESGFDLYFILMLLFFISSIRFLFVPLIENDSSADSG
jgi:hypothetical protein